MAKALAPTNLVIYVNHPYSFKDVVSGLRAGDPVLRRRLWHLLSFRTRYETVETIPSNFVAVQPPMTLPINFLPNGALYRFLQNINNRIVQGSIRRALRRQGVTDFVYINCYDPFFVGTLPKSMGARVQIYHCIDDISQNPYTVRHGLRLENEAAQNADITFVTSTNLHELKKPYAQRIVEYFNAADVENFGRVLTETFPRPTELAGKKGRTIGFVGNLDELRIDFPLLKKVALAFPNDTLLLIGPVNSAEPAAIGLDQLPNVVMAGSRTLQALPPLVQHMDVALIPFLKNTLTKSIYPLKINEYLAAGKPVVATGFSNDIRGFGHCAYIAESDEAFIDMIEKAMQEDSPERVQARVQTAAGNTWPERIKFLKELVGV